VRVLRVLRAPAGTPQRRRGRRAEASSGFARGERMPGAEPRRHEGHEAEGADPVVPCAPGEVRPSPSAWRARRSWRLPSGVQAGTSVAPAAWGEARPAFCFVAFLPSWLSSDHTPERRSRNMPLCSAASASLRHPRWSTQHPHTQHTPDRRSRDKRPLRLCGSTPGTRREHAAEPRSPEPASLAAAALHPADVDDHRRRRV